MDDWIVITLEKQAKLCGFLETIFNTLFSRNIILQIYREDKWDF